MPVTLDAIMKIYKMLTKNVTEKLILVRESKIFLIQHIVQVCNKILVSFETRNLCTFLLCLFRSIISSLVNDYYLTSFLFQSVSFKHMYQILYFIVAVDATNFLCYSCTIRYRRFIYNL